MSFPQTADVRRATGPTSPEGKAISSRNSEKHHVFDSAGVKYYESQEAYNRLLHRHTRHFRPQSDQEQTLVCTIVSAAWLLERLDRLEPKLIDAYAQQNGKTADDAFAELFLQPKNSPLLHLYRRRNQAQNQWFRAIKELQRLQKARGKQPQSAPPESPEEFVPTGPNSSDPIPSIAPDNLR
jgi:hypothetical protein